MQDELEKTALDQGRTDRISLTHDLDLQSLRALVMTYTRLQKFGSEDMWKQADGRDGWTDGGDCITSHANSVGK